MVEQKKEEFESQNGDYVENKFEGDKVDQGNIYNC